MRGFHDHVASYGAAKMLSFRDLMIVVDTNTPTALKFTAPIVPNKKILQGKTNVERNLKFDFKSK